MSPEAIVTLVGVSISVLGLLVLIYKKIPKRVKRSKITQKWRDIQNLCAEKHNWPQAVLLADQLLGDVLRMKRKDGRTMGERMVSSQKDFSNNDGIWQAHKLANRIRQNREIPLKEAEVKQALVAFRQALRDLGAV
jgi:hypothetical protein